MATPLEPAPPPVPPARKPGPARWLVPLAILFVFVAFCGGIALVLLGTAMSVERVSKGSVLELELRGELREAPDPLASILPGLAGPPSLFEVRKALRQAADDGNIAAVKVDVEPLAIGWGEAEELTEAFDDFRKSGKPVHAFLRGDLVSDVDYAAVLGADHIWLAPEAMVAVNGLEAEVEFWRGTLDKLHIEPQFYGMKEYKSAAEPFMRREMSEYFREATTAVMNDIWSHFGSEVAARRKVDAAALEHVVRLGLMTAEEARKASLVDTLGYEDEIRAELQAVAHASEYHGVSVRRYLDHASPEEVLSTRKKLAVVFGEGPIVSTSTEGLFSSAMSGPVVASAIRKAANDASVSGILFRVNSPGGSPVGSDHVWRAIEYARHEKKKPVVVSMSSVAGSGGYWVAMGADAIVARPTTVTGSIGVVFGKLNVSGLYELVGAHVDTIQLGESADLLSVVRSFDEPQRARVLAVMEGFYEQFKGKVAKGRGLPAAKVEEIARGRIWSGTAASANGLVDELGGYDRATALLREKAGIGKDEEVDLVVYPRARTLFEVLFEEDSGSARALRAALDPRQRLEQALAELTRPGAWLLMPRITVR